MARRLTRWAMVCATVWSSGRGRSIPAGIIAVSLCLTAGAGIVVSADRHAGRPTRAAAVRSATSVVADADAMPLAAIASQPPVAAPATRNVARSEPLFPKVKHLVPATLLISSRYSLSPRLRRALRRIAGVRRTETVAAGHTDLDGHPAFVLGVNPQSFRAWTPTITADSAALWTTVRGGAIAASFDMGSNAQLPLGQTVPLRTHRGVTPLRLGAFASTGLASVDAVVSSAEARQIGLPTDSGLLISAPKANPAALRKAVARVIGKRAHDELLNELVITRDAGEFMTRAQIAGFLQAAASRAGAPYVWGATGPDAFDCSGLVQWSFAQIGIRMPRVAAEQFFAGPHIPYADARPGDLIFYHFEPNDPTFVSHVVIYVGNGEMLEAPHTGDVVKLAPVPLNDMAGVVRVDPAVAARIAG